MKRANEDDENEVKQEEVKQEIEPQPLDQNFQYPELDLSNEAVQEAEVVNPPKRRRINDDETEIRLLISTKMAGAIIGKSGQNIQKLRSNHDAKINIVDCKGPERVLTIISSLDICYGVIRDVLKIIEPSKSNEYDLRLLIHQSLAGCIIGKGGSKIKELKSKFGCHVRVFPNVAPHSFERVVQINGNEEASNNCFNEIMNTIKSNNIRGAVRFYDPHNFDDVYAGEYGGFGNGSNVNMRNGNVPPFQRYTHDNNNNINNNRVRFNNNDRRDDNRRNNVKNQPNFAEPWAPKSFGNNQVPQMNNFGVNNMSNDFIAFDNFMNHQPEQTSTQVSIPTSMAGACIGKGGCRIRSIRDESKASIKIAQPLPGSNDRIITITGTPKQIQSAQYLLQLSVQNGMN